MYRVIEMGGTYYAIKMKTSGRSLKDEFEEIEAYLNEGTDEVILINNIKEYKELRDIEIQIIERDYL